MVEKQAQRFVGTGLSSWNSLVAKSPARDLVNKAPRSPHPTFCFSVLTLSLVPRTEAYARFVLEIGLHGQPAFLSHAELPEGFALGRPSDLGE